MSDMKTKLGFVILCFMIELVTDSPGISLGFTESGGAGQAVVLTLVDSASKELEQQATRLLAASAEAANVTSSVTVPLPSESDEPPVQAANQSAPDDLYVVRAEPKQVDATSQPTPAASSTSEQPPLEGVAASEKTQDTVTEDGGVPTSESQQGAANNETGADLGAGAGADSGAGTGAEGSSHEEIPSFSEWAQKQLAEAEKKKSENKTTRGGGAGSGGVAGGGSGGGGAVKRLRPLKKNYASPECGAKVVATNPEASSVWAVLSSSRDEYLLNSCSNKIWFVVELCEAIQPEKIELANFELFSSILREFSVSVSLRHPSRDWSQAGAFEAREVRTIQSFALAPQPQATFVKYIRVEFHSHYGSEHYCPVSLFRVYGTSEFEVLDTVDEAHGGPAPAAAEELDEEEDDEEDLAGGAGGVGAGGGREGGIDKPRNLFSSARDAVLSIVKRAAQVLVVKGEGEKGVVVGDGKEGKVAVVVEGDSAGGEQCVTPAYIIVCDNCSDALYNSVHHDLSCHWPRLEHVVGAKGAPTWGAQAVARSQVCKARGLDLVGGQAGGAPFPMPARTSAAQAPTTSHYMQVMLPDHTLIALCNVLAVNRKQVVLNITYDLVKEAEETRLGGDPGGMPGAVDSSGAATTAPTSSPASAATCTPNSTGVTQDQQGSKDAQIKPTRTLAGGGDDSLSQSDAADVGSATGDGVVVNATGVADTLVVATAAVKTVSEDQGVAASGDSGGGNAGSAEESMLEYGEVGGGSLGEVGGGTLDSLFSELDEVDDAAPAPAPVPTPTAPKQQTQQRESVFLRLAKRIKALERNMSLSGQYLEEMSRRYKRQVEEMQRQLVQVTEQLRSGGERAERSQQLIDQLTGQVAKVTAALETLVDERNTWAIKHGAVIVVEVVVFAVILLVCRWLPEAAEGRSRGLVWRGSGGGRSGGGLARRSSVDGSCPRPYPPNPRLRKRRPSEEALRISGSTHQDLLIPDGSRKNSRAENRRRRRKKKDQQQTTFHVNNMDTASSTNSRQVAPVASSSTNGRQAATVPLPPPLPPPPQPPPPVMLARLLDRTDGVRCYVVPVATAVPPPPSYPPMPTAQSVRKKRKESLRAQSSSDLSEDSSAPSASSPKQPSVLVKKAGPLKKIMRKLF
ncbi:uncharacterized protein LOC111045445 isoform X2 [Nilaparvata lugens]|uniref:uncharacterized protein LOC111045445 isoform X2 n=1 Tax=Nilaparvata lugens TaxID=108931 RepID=UPI00193CADB2|nr:uncharacterized protein LOC111045445 isoform X2 [Nilaparvata lugens]